MSSAARTTPEAVLEHISTPLAVITKLFEDQGIQDGSDYRPQEFSRLVRDHFQGAFADAETFKRIPVFSQPGAPKSGSLVRFRCMVQDPGYGEELHLSLARAVNTETGEVQQRFSQYTDAEHSLAEGWEVDYSSTGNVFTEKEVAYCVSVPGLSPWAQLEAVASLESAMDALSISAGSAEAGKPSGAVEVAEHKYPLRGERHSAALVKFYSPSTAPKVSTVIDVVGIYELGHNSRTQDADEEKAAWPCIHAIYHVGLSSGGLVPGARVPACGEYAGLRDMCQAHLASVLGGDDLAAQYLLLHLLSRTVRVQDAKVGKFSLNLIGIPAQDKAPTEPARFAFSSPASRWIGDAIAQLVPRSVEIPFDLKLLNRAAFVPSAEQGDLQAGVLQLPADTEVICDETCLHEGTLDEGGVRNLHALQTAILSQSIAYIYPFQHIEMQANLRVLVLSVGKSILQNDCDLHLSKDAAQFLARLQAGGAADLRPLDPMHTEQLRQYLEAARSLDFTIPKDVSDGISGEYASMRRNAHEQGGQLMTQEDLALAVTVARLVSISKGEAELTLASWQEACALEQRRKERAASAKRAQPASSSPPPL
ncbi:hypothetical protein LPJ61_000115 [Coemansia biformis]|uniref:Mini-chromosome maintenance replisome factor-domain-containing protein n=1 Tax=Coemansia biformis TaxID=1286918 RepID=A0A9W7YIX1_9FUNG|nr:hypothetical protein LPJ61_000115 [Coemansia biformis]